MIIGHIKNRARYAALGEDIMQASEVFDVGDGRYLIVEG